MTFREAEAIMAERKAAVAGLDGVPEGDDDMAMTADVLLRGLCVGTDVEPEEVGEFAASMAATGLRWVAEVPVPLGHLLNGLLIDALMTGYTAGRGAS